jgi:hypothetical protein
MAITVSAQDVADARLFITEYVTNANPDGDYSDGAAFQDLAIKAVAGIVALMRKEASQINIRTSLRRILEVDTADDPTAADDAADAIISNLYETRRGGQYSRVMGYALSTKRIDITVRKNVVFYKTADLPFLLDYGNEDLYIAAESLVGIFDSSGVVIGYQFKIPLIALRSGDAFNIDPGKFAYFDGFNPYVVQVETLAKASGGAGVETTPALIARAGTAITVRNLINPRSCDAVLKDEFSEITALSVVGMGDQEMTRDREREATTGVEVHTGGCQDIFVNTAVIETSVVGTVGGRFLRPDGVINVFRDATYADYDPVDNPTGHKFTEPDLLTGRTIAVGTVLRIWSGLPVGARDYIVHGVFDTQLFVSERTPFPVATDEQSSYVEWTVGEYMPNYEDIVGHTTTGETSRYTQLPGCVVLPGGPLYRVKEVTIDDMADADADPTTGLVYFNNRVNTVPTEQVAPDNQYQIEVFNPGWHQSMQSFAVVRVGLDTNATKYDGKTLKITYETLAAFENIDFRVSNRRDRISAASPLVRGYHPLYLSFMLEYSRLRNATGTIDEEEATTKVATFIDSFLPTEIIDMSTIATFFQQSYPDIVGQVYPFTITYEVHVPDGRIILFASPDLVTVPTDVTKLRTLQGLASDAVSDATNLLDPLEYGLCDDVVGYHGLAGQIGIQVRS